MLRILLLEGLRKPESSTYALALPSQSLVVILNVKMRGQRDSTEHKAFSLQVADLGLRFDISTTYILLSMFKSDPGPE